MTVENIPTDSNKEKETTPQEEETKSTETVALSVQKPSSLLPGNRPIDPSRLQIVNSSSSFGSTRPIVKSDLKISSTMTLSGNRPIAVATLNISEMYRIMGDRPVASNEIDDPITLMGWLD